MLRGNVDKNKTIVVNTENVSLQILQFLFGHTICLSDFVANPANKYVVENLSYLSRDISDTLFKRFKDEKKPGYLPSDLKIFEKLRDRHEEILLNHKDECEDLNFGETIPGMGVNLDMYSTWKKKMTPPEPEPPVIVVPKPISRKSSPIREPVKPEVIPRARSPSPERFAQTTNVEVKKQAREDMLKSKKKQQLKREKQERKAREVEQRNQQANKQWTSDINNDRKGANKAAETKKAADTKKAIDQRKLQSQVKANEKVQAAKFQKTEIKSNIRKKLDKYNESKHSEKLSASFKEQFPKNVINQAGDSINKNDPQKTKLNPKVNLPDNGNSSKLLKISNKSSNPVVEVKKTTKMSSNQNVVQKAPYKLDIKDKVKHDIAVPCSDVNGKNNENLGKKNDKNLVVSDISIKENKQVKNQESGKVLKINNHKSSAVVSEVKDLMKITIQQVPSQKPPINHAQTKKEEPSKAVQKETSGKNPQALNTIQGKVIQTSLKIVQGNLSQIPKLMQETSSQLVKKPQGKSSQPTKTPQRKSSQPLRQSQGKVFQESKDLQGKSIPKPEPENIPKLEQISKLGKIDEHKNVSEKSGSAPIISSQIVKERSNQQAIHVQLKSSPREKSQVQVNQAQEQTKTTLPPSENATQHSKTLSRKSPPNPQQPSQSKHETSYNKLVHQDSSQVSSDNLSRISEPTSTGQNLKDNNEASKVEFVKVDQRDSKNTSLSTIEIPTKDPGNLITITGTDKTYQITVNDEVKEAIETFSVINSNANTSNMLKAGSFMVETVIRDMFSNQMILSSDVNTNSNSIEHKIIKKYLGSMIGAKKIYEIIQFINNKVMSNIANISKKQFKKRKLKLDEYLIDNKTDKYIIDRINMVFTNIKKNKVKRIIRNGQVNKDSDTSDISTIKFNVHKLPKDIIKIVIRQLEKFNDTEKEEGKSDELKEVKEIPKQKEENKSNIESKKDENHVGNVPQKVTSMTRPSDPIQLPLITDSSRNMEDVTEEMKSTAHQAFMAFKDKDLVATSEYLNKLYKLKPNDLKVKMNIAIVNFCKEGRKGLTDLYNSLVEIIASIDMDKEDNRVNARETLGIAGLTDMIPCFYNLAIALRMEQKQTEACSMLNHCVLPAMQFIDTDMIKKILLLYVELHLAICQPHKGVEVFDKVLVNLKSTKCGIKNARFDCSDENDLQLSYFKARCYLQLQSLRSVRYELKFLTVNVGMTLPILHLKSHYEYLRGNMPKAIKYLNMTSSSSADSNVASAASILYYNNMSVIHAGLRKHNLTLFYARKALDNTNTKRARTTNQKRARLSMLYNVAIALLKGGYCKQAFECLMICKKSYIRNPRIYLRLAECCILQYTQENSIKMSSVHADKLRGKILIKKLKPSRIHRRYRNDGSGMSLNNAMLFIQTGLSLFNSAKCVERLAKEDQALFGPIDARINSGSGFIENIPGLPLNEMSIGKIRMFLLCTASYVSFVLQDYLKCFDYAERLLSMDADKFSVPIQLGHLARKFATDACLVINRLGDAYLYSCKSLAVLKSSIAKLQELPKKPALAPTIIFSDVNECQTDKPEIIRITNEYWSDKELMVEEVKAKLNHSMLQYMKGDIEDAKQTYSSCFTIGEKIPVEHLHGLLYHTDVYISFINGEMEKVCDLQEHNGIEDILEHEEFNEF